MTAVAVAVGVGAMVDGTQAGMASAARAVEIAASVARRAQKTVARAVARRAAKSVVKLAQKAAARAAAGARSAPNDRRVTTRCAVKAWRLHAAKSAAHAMSATAATAGMGVARHVVNPAVKAVAARARSANRAAQVRTPSCHRRTRRLSPSCQRRPLSTPCPAPNRPRVVMRRANVRALGAATAAAAAGAGIAMR